MLTKITLHGVLAEGIEPVWHLDVATPSEAVSAIEANHRGFVQRLIELGEQGITFRILVGEREITKDELKDPLGACGSMDVVPIPAGSGIETFASIMAFQIVEGLTVGAMIVSTLISFALTGLAKLLTPTPDVKAGEDTTAAENKPSAYFDGPINTSGQGLPVPIAYGEVLVGGHVIDVGLSAVQV
jgi:predicted phage tail protein